MNIIFTESAQQYLAQLLEKQAIDGIGVRLFVAQPGTPHAETCLAYCKPGEQKDDDLILTLNSFICYVEKVSERYLEEALVDFAEDTLGGQLTIKAPNAKLPKITESSTLEEKVNYVLQTEINPNLAAHGGMVNLVEMDGNTAVLQFGGGCQGCGMIDITLKDGVEATLMDKIKELDGVVDITDHTIRENAYDRS